MRLEQWGAGKEHYRMASEYPEYVLGIDHTFSDIEELVGQCRFSGCSHGNEPGCAVRQAVKDGLITEE